MLSQRRGLSHLPTFKIIIQSKEGAAERLVVKPSKNLGFKFECVENFFAFFKVLNSVRLWLKFAEIHQHYHLP
jgi:hypothetical protein